MNFYFFKIFLKQFKNVEIEWKTIKQSKFFFYFVYKYELFLKVYRSVNINLSPITES